MRRPLLTSLLLQAMLQLIVGCSSFSKPSSIQIIDSATSRSPLNESFKAPEDLRSARLDIEAGRFAEAEAKLSSFLQRNPTSPWTQAAIFQRGRSLEALDRWDEAAEDYRRVIAATERQAPNLQARALYRITFCFEALGDDQQTLAALHDLLARSTGLPIEVSRAELPARLAGTYARVGNFDKAVEYYRQAEKGLAQLRKGQVGKTESIDWLPPTLYSMGALSTRSVSWEDFETVLRPLARSQIYLLQAAELNREPWADRAAKDFISTYTKLWTVIENPPFAGVSEPIIERRALREKQLSRAELLNENLLELTARALPLRPAADSPASAILDFAKTMRQRIGKLFNERPFGEGLTDEAKARSESVRGRTVNTSDVLEKKFLNSARSAPSLEPIAKDPNL